MGLKRIEHGLKAENLSLGFFFWGYFVAWFKKAKLLAPSLQRASKEFNLSDFIVYLCPDVTICVS